MSFREIQAEVDGWISQFEEGYWQPLAMMARITEEAGELAREVNHRFGEKPKKSSENESTLEEEIADLIFVLVAFANSRGIDLDEAFASVMTKYRSRDSDRWRPLASPRPGETGDS